MRRIAFVIAHTGFQPVEYSVPKEILLDAGMKVLTVSNKADDATDTKGKTVEVDTTVEELDPANYDALIFIGGSGCLENLDNQSSYTAIKNAWNADKVVGAICVAPIILAKAGVLEGKEATGWDEHESLISCLKEHGATYVERDVVIDGRVITAAGPHAAEKFGFALVRLLG